MENIGATENMNFGFLVFFFTEIFFPAPASHCGSHRVARERDGALCRVALEEGDNEQGTQGRWAKESCTPAFGVDYVLEK